MLEIKRVQLDHANLLQDVAKKTFLETFSEQNNLNDMANYVEQNFSIDKLKKEIQDSGSIFYFAFIKDSLAGYLKVNFDSAQTEDQSDAMEVERIYLLKKYQGKGIGLSLLEKAISLAKQRKKKYVWLGVWEENRQAISFYKKNGFLPFGSHIFTIGTDEQTDIMMRLPLSY